MQKKTLGGDRLGSGKKMQVELHGYERSTHDLGYVWRNTMSFGTLVPFMKQVALPGDTFDIELEVDVKTHPTVGPMFGTAKIQLDIFQCPMRLYNSWLHNNMLNIGRNMSQVKLPLIEFEGTNLDEQILAGQTPDNLQINPSCILSYLGIRGAGMVPATAGPYVRQFNAIPFLAYWEIYKNYYANKQEEEGAVIHTQNQIGDNFVDDILINGNTLEQFPAVGLYELSQAANVIRQNWTGAASNADDIMIQLQYAGWRQLSTIANFNSQGAGFTEYRYNWGTWGTDYVLNWRFRQPSDLNTISPRVTRFPLDNIDQVRQEILAFPGNTPYIVNEATVPPYQYPLMQNGTSPTDTINTALNSQEGLAVKTHQNDLFNNWLSTEWIDGPGGITEITAISTADGDKFTIDTLNLSKKVYDMLNRIAVSGGSYDDWLDVVYDHDRFQRAESPIYCGGLIRELVFQEVVSNSAAETSSAQPLGTLAGKGVMAQKRKGGTVVIKVDEPSYIIGIVSATPRIDYSQGNDWDTHLLTMDDLHKPALDQIGFQELIKEQMAWWDTKYAGGEWQTFSAGKQPAWINYMTNYNKALGNFAIQENEMFMTFNRRYQYDPGTGIFDMTTYIDPAKFNYIFAETSIDAMNLWVQIGCDITARRKMSGKLMPTV